MNLWARLQLLKVHYQMGALGRQEFIAALDRLYEEAK